LIRSFDEDPSIQILKGRYGAYIAKDKNNYRIPKGKTAESLTLEDCLEIIKNSGEKPVVKRKK